MTALPSHEITRRLLAWSYGDQEALKVSQRKVEREWSLARAWLYRELRGKDES